MPRHKKGTLVRAFTKEELGEEKWGTHSCEEFIEPNGYLYIVQRRIPTKHHDNEHDAPAYECKSLTTGELVQLFPEEITSRRKADE